MVSRLQIQKIQLRREEKYYDNARTDFFPRILFRTDKIQKYTKQDKCNQGTYSLYTQLIARGIRMLYFNVGCIFVWPFGSC